MERLPIGGLFIVVCETSIIGLPQTMGSFPGKHPMLHEPLANTIGRVATPKKMGMWPSLSRGNDA